MHSFPLRGIQCLIRARDIRKSQRDPSSWVFYGPPDLQHWTSPKAGHDEGFIKEKDQHFGQIDPSALWLNIVGLKDRLGGTLVRRQASKLVSHADSSARSYPLVFLFFCVSNKWTNLPFSHLQHSGFHVCNVADLVDGPDDGPLRPKPVVLRVY
jgi:hypothetical protein